MKRAPAGFSRKTFDELVAAWLDTQTSANTRAAYGRDLRAFASWFEAASRRSPLAATSADLADFQAACVEDGASPASVQRRMSAVSSFFRWTFETGSRATNPMLGVDRTTVERIDEGAAPGLDADEVRHLLAATAATDPKSAVLVALLVRDGLRLSEILALDVPDVLHRPTSPAPLQPPERPAGPARGAARPPRRPGVVIDEGLLAARVNRRGREELLELDRRTGVDLRRYLGHRASGPLLLGDSPTTDGDRRLTRFGADYLLKRVGRAAGLRHPLTAGTLRTTYAATARAAGATVDDIRHQLGHRDARSTRRILGGTDDHQP